MVVRLYSVFMNTEEAYLNAQYLCTFAYAYVAILKPPGKGPRNTLLHQLLKCGNDENAMDFIHTLQTDRMLAL